MINVGSTGISERKAFYSNYGLGYIDLAAPGGDLFDTADNRQDFTKGVLTTWPRSLVAPSEIDATGTPTVPYLVRDCRGRTCAYYRYFQGTSSASPHAAGVAALIVVALRPREANPARGLTLDPDETESILVASARTPCVPGPAGLHVHPRPAVGADRGVGPPRREGTAENNGFYGEGIVDAQAAVAAGPGS